MVAEVIVEDEHARATRSRLTELAETVSASADVLREAADAADDLRQARGTGREEQAAARLYALAETLDAEYGLRVEP